MSDNTTGNGNENVDFNKLRKELLSLELGAESVERGVGQMTAPPDLKLPSETLDWTPWITPNRKRLIGGGGFGHAFMGEWKGVPPSLGPMPQVVVKVMKVDLLPSAESRKRYVVRLSAE